MKSSLPFLNRSWALLLVALASCGVQAHDPPSESDYFADHPVVLSASRLAQPMQRAPAPVTVITREMIEASGFRHLVDVLRLVPGFLVGWSGGNVPAATYLGLANALPRRMQVMVDGRSVYNPAYGHTTWRGIPLTLDEVDRIEVVRGPNAANDGLNSVLGTIHIYTLHSSLTQGTRVKVAAGNAGYRETSLRHGAQHENGSVRLSVLGREDERHNVAWDHASDLMATLRADFQPTGTDEITIHAGWSKGDWLGSNAATFTSPDQEALHQSGHLNAIWRHAPVEGQEWSLQLHHTYSQNKEPLTLPAFMDPMGADYRTGVTALQLAYQDMRRSDVHFSLAGEYRLNRVRMPDYLDSDGYVRDQVSRLSGGVEWYLGPDWVLHGAAMVENHSDTDGTQFSPRVAVNWLPAPGHAFRLGYARAASALNLFANHTDVRLTRSGQLLDQIELSLNPIKPEEIRSQELGYLFTDPERHLNLGTRVFRNRLSDIVTGGTVPYANDPVTGDGLVRTFRNTVSASQRGLEYQLTWQPEAHRWIRLAQSWVERDADNARNYVRSIPRTTLSLQAASRIGSTDLSLGYYRVSDMLWISGDRDRLSHYNRLDLRLARSWKTASGDLEAALVLQSPLGKEFESFDGDLYKAQVFRRQGYVSVRYDFR